MDAATEGEVCRCSAQSLRTWSLFARLRRDKARGVPLQTHKLPKMSVLLMGAAPALLAFVAVALEPVLTAWSHDRAAALPLGTVLLLAVLLHPQMRNLLMITLCYGVSFLALRDITRLAWSPLPQPLNYEEWEVLRLLDLILVAGLSATAAVCETVRPGTVWARRFYFGAACLYFLGLGIITYFRNTSWQAILLAITGITAGVGCVFAHKIVATEALEVESAPLQSDEVLQQTREAAHRAALQAKEWRDSLYSPDLSLHEGHE